MKKAISVIEIKAFLILGIIALFGLSKKFVYYEN